MEEGAPYKKFIIFCFFLFYLTLSIDIGLTSSIDISLTKISFSQEIIAVLLSYAVV